jgi:hypothetical protein
VLATYAKRGTFALVIVPSGKQWDGNAAFGLMVCVGAGSRLLVRRQSTVWKPGAEPADSREGVKAPQAGGRCGFRKPGAAVYGNHGVERDAVSGTLAAVKG